MNSLKISLLTFSALSLTVSIHAGALVKFKAGKPAIADSINANFEMLDSAIQTKVSQAVADSLGRNMISKDSFNYAFSLKQRSQTGQFGQIQILSETEYDDEATLGKNELVFMAGGPNRAYEAGAMTRLFSSEDKLTIAFAGSGQGQPSFTTGLVIQPQGITVPGDINLTGSLITPVKSFPDYVFSSGYKLSPLSDVEKFIQKNKHLPDVPSAEKVSRDGMDLVQMNLILMRKVEELTLYVIEQQKQIEAINRK